MTALMLHCLPKTYARSYGRLTGLGIYSSGEKGAEMS